MDKEKVLQLHDYFYREIRQHLNPLGKSSPHVIANKISFIIDYLKTDDVSRVKESLLDKAHYFWDEDADVWYNELLVSEGTETDRAIDKLVSFYITKSKLTQEEKDFYKTFQEKNYWGYKK